MQSATPVITNIGLAKPRGFPETAWDSLPRCSEAAPSALVPDEVAASFSGRLASVLWRSSFLRFMAVFYWNACHAEPVWPRMEIYLEANTRSMSAHGRKVDRVKPYKLIAQPFERCVLRHAPLPRHPPVCLSACPESGLVTIGGVLTIPPRDRAWRWGGPVSMDGKRESHTPPRSPGCRGGAAGRHSGDG